ncbi:MAG TPA: twin-arginine translocation signal domain-containing protein, partial [Chitinophagaceae bacterium]|nr:twin-arginine translocation signal domain-containing protein [Chitinophagaceae bacterium]
MKTNRRNFLKYSGLTGIGFAGAGVMKTYAGNTEFEKIKTHHQHFNMSGYAAPKLETVRIG